MKNIVFKSPLLWVIVLVAAAGVYFIPINHSFFSLQLKTSPTPVPDYSGWKIYSNSKFGVSLKYPPAYYVKAGQTGPLAEWSLYGLTNGNEIASVEIPKSTQIRTNFGGASLRMGFSKEAIAIKECLTPPPSFGYRDMYSRRDIGGVMFKEFSRSDAAAGNYYLFTSYRAVRNDGCEVFEYVIHYSNLQNYPPEVGRKEYDKQKVVDSLESILGTVKFLK